MKQGDVGAEWNDNLTVASKTASRIVELHGTRKRHECEHGLLESIKLEAHLVLVPAQMQRRRPRSGEEPIGFRSLWMNDTADDHRKAHEQRTRSQRLDRYRSVEVDTAQILHVVRIQRIHVQHILEVVERR